MTGFARGSVATDTIAVTVEIRSVNNRYLDVQFRVPDMLRSQEPRWREDIAKYFSRGKIDVGVKVDVQDTDAPLRIDHDRLVALRSALAAVAEEFPGATSPDQLALLMAPGVLGAAQAEESAWVNAANESMTAALLELRTRRQEEGLKLAQMVRSRAEDFRGHLANFKAILPELQTAQRQRILDRLAQLQHEPDGKRLEEELVYSAQKSDVDEELDRLETHLQAITAALDGKAPCGRRLDFLMQELNREANTLASKSSSITTTETAVEFKVLIEQMREQIQNLE